MKRGESVRCCPVILLNRVEDLPNRAEWRHAHFFSPQSLEVIFPWQEEIDPTVFRWGVSAAAKVGDCIKLPTGQRDKSVINKVHSGVPGLNGASF